MLPRLLDSNMRETKRLNALDASITERIIPLSTATVILPDTETLPLRSWVRMFNGYGESAIYRVNTPGLNIDNCTSEYQLDHGVCEIGDYIINSDAEYSGAANTVISQIFSNYRGSLWQLGTVAATDQVEVNSDHGDVLSALLDAVEQLPDYAISLDQSATPWTFAVVAKSSAVGGEGRLSRNIASLDISEDTSALCTRLYGDALTGGHMDADTISLYGVVEQYAGKGEGTTQEKYLADCQKYLNQHKHPLRVIKIDLHDLHAVTGEPLDKAELGKLYRLALPKYNITESQRVFAREWPSLYGDPEHIVVTLGNEAMDMNALFDSYSATSASNSSKEKRKSEAQSAKWRFTDKHVTDQGEILHAAGLEMDAHGVWLYASEDGPNYALGSSFKVQADAITSEVSRATTAEGQLGSRITETATEIRSDVYAANSQIYSTIQQTASSITSVIENTEQGLYSYIQQTASGIRQTFNATSNRTIVNDTDPRSETYTPKDGDIWIESVHDGTWDGADGFDWEHDEDYDWTQVQGAKVWTWKNNQWQLVADRQQLVNYSDFVNTADILISQKITELANEEGMIEVYRSLIEQTGEQIRSEVYSATSDIYSYVRQTASNIAISLGGGAHVVTQDAIKDGVPIYTDEQGNIRVSEDGYVLKDGDIWIDTANQNTWDAALEWNWNDDAVYDWSELRDDDVYVYSAELGQWVKRVNGRVYTDQIDLDITNDHITANMRSIDLVRGEMRENAHQFSVTTEELRSTFNDRIRNMGSELKQTTDAIKSEYYAANSKIYSQLIQTASSLTSKFENEIEGVGSSITQTASEIRSEVHAANSTVWSHIKQNADSIELKVSKNGVVSAINQTAESIQISASKINLEGYVTATQLEAMEANISNLTSGRTTATLLKTQDMIATSSITAHSLYLGGSGSTAQNMANCIRDFGTATSSGGSITIPTTRIDGTAGPSINFNIADTQYYKDGVSAAKNDRSVTSANFSLTNVTEYPSANMVAFNVVATANDGTTYTSNLKSVTYTGSGGGGGGSSSIQFGTVRSRSVAAVGANVYINYSLDGGNTWRSHTATVKEYTG